MICLAGVFIAVGTLRRRPIRAQLRLFGKREEHGSGLGFI